MGSAGVELMLSDTNGSSRLSGSVRGRAPSSIKRDLREYAAECAQATLDLNRKALGLLIESTENTYQARIQAIRARQHFENLLSVSRVIVSACAQDNAMRMRVLLVQLVRLVISTAGRPTMNAA